MAFTRAEVGAWLRELETGAIFEVVACDPNGGAVEIQYLDGTLGEYDADSWRSLLLEPVAEPEDWRAAFELAEEDALDPDMPFHPEDWGGPLNSIEPEHMRGVEER